jgi:hypothetical protein
MRPILTILSCFLLSLSLLAGCSGPERGPGLSVSEGTVSTSEVHCEIGQNPIDNLKQCGLGPSERERALTLLAAEKQAKLRQAKKKLGRPTDEELLWMARVMYTEAPTMRLMTYAGSTVIERVNMEEYPNTVRGVATQRWQFEGITRNAQNVRDLTLEDYGSQNLKWNLAVRSAHFILTTPERYRPLKGIDHFWSPQSADKRPNWAHRSPEYQVGDKFEFHNLIN